MSPTAAVLLLGVVGAAVVVFFLQRRPVPPPVGGWPEPAPIAAPPPPQEPLPPSQRTPPAPVPDGGVVLIVDDDDLIRSFLRRGLARRGFTPVLAESGEAALQALRERSDIAAVLLDLNLGGVSGAAVLDEIRTDQPALPVFMMTGSDRETLTGLEAADGVLQKPFQLHDVLSCLRDG